MRYELAIGAMHCEGCASSIERYLRDQPGVEAAAVDFEAGRGWVEVNADADVTALVDAVRSMGYDASLADAP